MADSATPTATPARVETRQGRRWWLCANCGQKLGEVVGARVIVRSGKCEVRLPVEKGPERDCPKCGQASGLVATG